LNADKGGCTQINLLESKSPRPETLNGTLIKSDASHTLIFADQAKSNLAFGVICGNPAFSASICVPLPLPFQDPKS
jgi:hypothetical protein